MQHAKNSLIVGSYALEQYNIFGPRKRLDIDIMSTSAEFHGIIESLRSDENTGGPEWIKRDTVKWIKQTDFGTAVQFKRGEIYDSELVEKAPGRAVQECIDLGKDLATIWVPVGGYFVPVATPGLVYTLKMSHRYLKNSPHFLKTRNDAMMLRKMGFGTIVNEEFFKAREKGTYTYGHPKLNVSTGDFFKPDVPYIYDHDTIHEAVAVQDRPAYTRYMSDGAQVLTSRQKFEALPTYVRLLGVLEESYVLALERSIIPHNSDPKKAFLMALSKVCTSITSGWFREFAWENYDRVLALYDPDFVEKFEAALAAGRIKPFKGKMY